jgi:hypothetical protein
MYMYMYMYMYMINRMIDRMVDSSVSTYSAQFGLRHPRLYLGLEFFVASRHLAAIVIHHLSG